MSRLTTTKFDSYEQMIAYLRKVEHSKNKAKALEAKQLLDKLYSLWAKALKQEFGNEKISVKDIREKIQFT